jgi:hypothetical protein
MTKDKWCCGNIRGELFILSCNQWYKAFSVGLSKYYCKHVSYMSIFIIFSSWTDQCQDCGKRFPNATKLNRHIKRVHGPRLKCNFCWWSCQSHQRQIEHERAHHNREGFVPAETPTFSWSVSSVIVPVTSSTGSLTPQQPLMSIDANHYDFSVIVTNFGPKLRCYGQQSTCYGFPIIAGPEPFPI